MEREGGKRWWGGRGREGGLITQYQSQYYRCWVTFSFEVRTINFHGVIVCCGIQRIFHYIFILEFQNSRMKRTNFFPMEKIRCTEPMSSIYISYACESFTQEHGELPVSEDDQQVAKNPQPNMSSYYIRTYSTLEEGLH